MDCFIIDGRIMIANTRGELERQGDSDKSIG